MNRYVPVAVALLLVLAGGAYWYKMEFLERVRVTVDATTLTSTTPDRTFSGTAKGLKNFQLSVYTNDGAHSGDLAWGAGVEGVAVDQDRWSVHVDSQLPKGLYSLRIFDPSCSIYDDSCKPLVLEAFEVK